MFFFLSSFKGYHSRGMIRMMPGGCLLPKYFTTLHDRIWNFEVNTYTYLELRASGLLMKRKMGKSWRKGN